MTTGKRKKKLGEERLQRIIDLCRSVEERGLDPFIVDVDDILAVIREYFPEWELPEEFCLDAEAIHRVASIIKLQSDWVKHRSTSLYTDPFLLEEKIRRLRKEELVKLFLRAWHPIVELEQMSTRSLVEAVKYWRDLLPLSERWLKTSSPETEIGVVMSEELARQGILVEKAFSEDLEALWGELKQKVAEEGENGKMRYWDFVGADTYAETVRRAYMTSFLVTYGYATLEIHRLEEEVFIKPYEKPVPIVGREQAVSVPIPISIEDWKRWKEGKTD